VMCRVRPMITEDGDGEDSAAVVSFDTVDEGVICVENKGRQQVFECDRVFNVFSSQLDVRSQPISTI